MCMSLLLAKYVPNHVIFHLYVSSVDLLEPCLLQPKSHQNPHNAYCYSFLQVPVCLLAAKYDPMEQMMLTVDLLQRVYAPRCIFKRFGKVRMQDSAQMSDIYHMTETFVHR